MAEKNAKDEQKRSAKWTGAKTQCRPLVIFAGKNKEKNWCVGVDQNTRVDKRKIKNQPKKNDNFFGKKFNSNLF